MKVERLSNGETLPRWDIAPGYYLYLHRLQITGLPTGVEPKQPPCLPYSNEFFGEQQIYRELLNLILPPGISGNIEIGWQSCADAGLCYPPQRKQLVLLSGQASSEPDDSLAQDQALTWKLESQTFALSLLVFFALGLLFGSAPCSLPMLPILAGIVVGHGASP